MGYIFDALTRSSKSTKQKSEVDSPSLKLTNQAATQTAVAPDLGSAKSPPPVPHRKHASSKSKYAQTHDIDERLVALTRPACNIAEEYRAIRTSILAKWNHKRHLVHVITSATPQEGKTLTSLNLGITFSELRNRKVLVIEADLRLPQFQKLLSLPDGPGLVHVLQNETSFDDAVIEVGDNGLHLLPAGRRVHMDAVQLLSSPTMESLLKFLRKRYDHIIIDTPPVVELADAGILGGLSDDIILIARMNCTPRPLITQAIRTLQSYNAPVAGIIATDQSQHHRRYYYYRYGYRYHYRYYTKNAA